jgi:hypothetical protein
MKVHLGNRCINIQTLPEAITLGSNFPATLGPTTGDHCIKQRTDASKHGITPAKDLHLAYKSMMEITSKNLFSMRDSIDIIISQYYPWKKVPSG